MRLAGMALADDQIFKIRSSWMRWMTYAFTLLGSVYHMQHREESCQHEHIIDREEKRERERDRHKMTDRP